jgi:ATP-dependent helicase HrpA
VLENLKQEIELCQLADQHRFRQTLQRLSKLNTSSKTTRTQIQELRKAVESSKQSCNLRILAIPSIIKYPEKLPVSGRAAEVVALLANNQVVVIAGDTGSGKTTQIPKMCLQAGYGKTGLIGHTQPRRLAAVSVANRIAEELGTEPGKGVGYQVRFNEKVSNNTFLKLMTDGILLAEIQQDKFLNRYEVIIIDEAHERSLNIDFLLGFLHQLLRKRPDLKLIITSATIDVEKFSRHFFDAPIVSVSGRTFPVEVNYMPLIETSSLGAEDDRIAQGVLDAIQEIITYDRKRKGEFGDILVFLSSEREIREISALLRKQRLSNIEVLPLYSRLPHSEQIKIFAPHHGRRIVLSTNVAETSLTVPGINYVIDSGFARMSRYNLQSKVQRLPIEPISQASANQRKGRCGRLADGICIRLYSEDDYKSRPEFTDPEIRRTNLASVILRMLHLRLGIPEDFPFLEPPERKAINEGFKLLIELNALTTKRVLTGSGRLMARFPVDPKFACMLVEASRQSCLAELLIIVSVLSIQDPRELNADNRQKAQQKHSVYEHKKSDFLSFVNLWKFYEALRQNSSQAQLRKYCSSNYLSYMRMREWREVHHQLLLSCQQMGLRINKEAADYSSVHLAIIAGSLNQIANKVEGRSYLGNRNKRFSLFSSSVVSGSNAKWIVSGELIETTQTFASIAAQIEPEWVEQMALHLIKREYSDPHWSKKKQAVMAYQKVTLYGLTIIERSLVTYNHIDESACRKIFIEEGIGQNEVRSRQEFILHNIKFLADLNRQEEKIRKPNMIVSEREIFDFYDRQLPAEVYSTSRLNKWLDTEKKQQPDILKMTLEALTNLQAEDEILQQYPDKASVQNNELAIDYAFDPGSKRDGATVEIPLALLSQTTQADLDWAVPGIIEEKCIALIKSLPKALRKKFIPVNDFVKQAISGMSAADGTLLDSLLMQVRNIKGLQISKSEFTGAKIPDHLQVKIRLVNEAGEEQGFGNDIDRLRMDIGINESVQFSVSKPKKYQHALEQSGLQNWEIEDLPAQVEVGDSLALIRYPALVDEGDTVAVALFAEKNAASAAMAAGLNRLYMLRSVQQKNVLKKQFRRFADGNALKIPKQLLNLSEQAVTASYLTAFQIPDIMPRCKKDFEDSLNNGKPKILGAADNIEIVLQKILDTRKALLGDIRHLKNGSLNYAFNDISSQLDRLLPKELLVRTSYDWLKELPRYLKASQLRIAKAPHLGAKDESNSLELISLMSRWSKLESDPRLCNSQELELLRWMIEEYRVSLFAQSLGTKIPVSAKRIEAQFEKISRTNL